MFKGELVIGQPAMIINVRQSVNSHMIGQVVIVESVMKAGDDISELFIGAKEAGVVIRARNEPFPVVAVSGSTRTAKTNDGRFSMRSGWTNFDMKNLMPLPPLDDEQDCEDAVINENKLEYA